MDLKNDKADIFVPDGMEIDAALARTTHLAVGAHQDDLEIMAYHGIMECYNNDNNWFTGVVVTNGGGSSRTGEFEKYTDDEMQAIRQKEQREAARIGEYAAVIQLLYKSSEVKDTANNNPAIDIQAILESARPDVVYLHNPADKHDTHVAVLLRSLRAIRAMGAGARPRKVYGCEVWRDLDWLVDDEKQALPADRFPDVAAALVGVYKSQISGGKRYDKATEGRRLANATYHMSHNVDDCLALTFAMDLTPLCADNSISIDEFVDSKIERFRLDVKERIRKLKRRE